MKIVKSQRTPRIYTSYRRFLGKSLISKGAIMLYCFFLGIIGVFVAAKHMSVYIASFFADVGLGAVQTLSGAMGGQTKEDVLGNINVLLAGYGGDQHDGGKLTDTIIVASYNPNVKSVMLFSIPRDLAVTYPNGGVGKINSLFPTSYGMSGDMTYAANILVEKAQEITGLEIPYYVFVDFYGFEAAIDTMGGITIDVPVAIEDDLFPGPNHTYDPFYLDAGTQKLDGETALKYVRTRHAKNGQGGDTNRAKRGQQVIKAAINKILSTQGITRIGSLIDTYNDYVFTNITTKTAAHMTNYIDSVKDVTSLVMMTYVFNPFKNIYLDSAQPAALLVETNDGRYMMLPDTGVTDDYSNMNEFVDFIVNHPRLAIDADTGGYPITVLNGVDDKANVAVNGSRIAYGYDIAASLYNYGFTIHTDALDTTDMPFTGSTIVVNIPKDPDTQQYPATVDILKEFLYMYYDIADPIVLYEEYYNPLYEPAGITVIIGNDVLSGTVATDELVG